MNHSILTISAVLSLVLSSACVASSGSNIRRAHPDEQIDLSGTWNDADANQVAAVMIEDCLTRPWSANFRALNGRSPVVRMYPIRNRTSEHIETKFFTKQVEQELLNSGTIELVGSLIEATDIRKERADQAAHASEQTMMHDRNETGSDYVLNGWIVEEHDDTYGRSVRAYVITMELIHAERNTKVWMKTHRIKKDIRTADIGW